MSEKPVRAISIRQPYVEAILRGIKKAEYRSIATRIRERVYIYASLKDGDWDLYGRRLRAEPGSLPTGAILGTVEIVDCVWDDELDCFAYVLKDPKRLARPLRATNQPQPIFWRPVFRKQRRGV